jgi:hypothetical protein
MPGLTTDSSPRQIEAVPQPSLSRGWRRTAHALLLALLLLTWGWLVWQVVIPTVQANVWPYSAYWIGPRLALEGRVHIFYADSSVYLPEIERLNVTADLLEVNPPTTLLLFLPLGLLPIGEAFRVWTVISLTCFAAGWLALLRAVRLPLWLGLLLTAGVPLFVPLTENIRGQAYHVLFALVALSVAYGENALASGAGAVEAGRRGQVIGGVLLGLAAALKLYYGLLLAVPAIVKRQWSLLLSAGFVIGATALATVLAWGTDIWERAIYLSLTWRGRTETVHTAYQTTHSLLGRLFRYDAQWSPGPVANLPWLAESLWWLVTLCSLGATVLALWRSRDWETERPPGWSLLAPCVTAPLASALAPIGESYHYALCLFPIVVLTAILYEAWRSYALAKGRRGLSWRVVAVSMGYVLALVLLGAPWQYNVARADGWANLMHYPRLYGALVLWLLMVVLLLRPGFIGNVEKAPTRIATGSAP